MFPLFNFSRISTSNGNQQKMTNYEGTQIRRRKPILHNKSNYKREKQGFDDPNQPGISSSTNFYSFQQTQYNSGAASLAAAHCSHLSESRDCSINSCFSWKVEKKEECFLPSKEQKCGKGTRKLLYTCVDHNGVSFTLYIHVQKYHNLNYLKSKKNVLPFDSMVMRKSKMQVDHKKGRKKCTLLIFHAKPLNQRKLHGFGVDKFMIINEPKNFDVFCVFLFMIQKFA